jgi:formylmethanofuran dehydrogenase subunit E
MLSKKMTNEEMAVAVSTSILERAQQDIESFNRIRQSNPSAALSSSASSSGLTFFKKMTNEEMAVAVSTSILERAQQDTEAFNRIRHSNLGAVASIRDTSSNIAFKNK